VEILTPRPIGLALVVLAVFAPPLAAQPPLESKLKAAIVSKLPQFVEWPSSALEGRSTIDLCIAAPDPFGNDLDELVAGESLGERKVAVRRIEREQDLAGCQLLVVAGPAATRRALLSQAATLPVLTVGDDARFLDEGGIVRLRRVDGRMRFDINADAARRAGLRISSQLLQLAASVRGAQE